MFLELGKCDQQKLGSRPDFAIFPLAIMRNQFFIEFFDFFEWCHVGILFLFMGFNRVGQMFCELILIG